MSPEYFLLDPFFYITLLFGLCFGSFATALSYRWPRGESILKKTRSACPSCHKPLSLVDLVPVFSWMFLRGKCRLCRATIGVRYPLIELATVFLCAGFYLAYGFTPQTFVMFALAAVVVSIVDIDLHHKVIPDSFNLSILLMGVIVLLMNAFSGDVDLREAGTSAVLGSFLYAGGSFLLRQVFMVAMKREPMGLGDVKFFAAAGFWLGAEAMTAAWFMLLSGGAGVLLALIWKRMTKEDEFPFGPALVLAFITLLFMQKTVLFL
jgi:prepilin signal peptidase PulO-like enzyme (type II secretory pathway)